jgi:hypothetical protein
MSTAHHASCLISKLGKTDYENLAPVLQVSATKFRADAHSNLQISLFYFWFGEIHGEWTVAASSRAKPAAKLGREGAGRENERENLPTI